MQLIDLLDRAKSHAGSDYKVAQLLGVQRQVLSDWRNGRKTCTPEDQALLAAVAGLDPEEALIRAVITKHANTAKGERLLTALGKGLVQTGAKATFAMFASVGFLLTMTERLTTMYRPKTA